MLKRQALIYSIAVAMAGSSAVPAFAYTELGESGVFTATATYLVDSSVSFSANLVEQGTGNPASQIDFGSFTTGAFIDSGEAIEVDVFVSSNNPEDPLLGNFLIVYTDNLGPSANPSAALDTSLGIDGAGLVGVSDNSVTVPIGWILTDENSNPTFDGDLDGIGETFLVDKAHVATFTTVNSALDNMAMVVCSTLDPVANTAGDGLYPQFFGNTAGSQDLCDAGDTDVVVSQELVKNIAVVAWGFGAAFDGGTQLPGDHGNIVGSTVQSPIYINIAADFTGKLPQDYQTTTLTVELITQ